MTLSETGQVMDLLRIAYPRFYAGADAPDPRDTLTLWATMFEPYPLEIVLAAVKAHIATDIKGYPPVIGQIMAKVRQITEPRERTEQEAWSIVLRAIRNSGYSAREEFNKLPDDIKAVVHDPAQLKAWAIDDDFNESVVSSNFMRSYRARQASAREFKALPKDVQNIALQMGAGFSLERVTGPEPGPRRETDPAELDKNRQQLLQLLEETEEFDGK